MFHKPDEDENESKKNEDGEILGEIQDLLSSNIKGIINKEVDKRVGIRMTKEKNIFDNHKSSEIIKIIERKKNCHKLELEVKKKTDNLKQKQLNHQENVDNYHIQIEEYGKKLEIKQLAINNCTKISQKDKLISINVGGKIYYTLMSTLTKVSPFFANLFSDKWLDNNNKTIRDTNGNIFIDHPSKYFDIIINWSRLGGNTKMLTDLIKKIEEEKEDYFAKDYFVNMLDYFGIEYIHPFNGLYSGKNISIYWRGNKKNFGGIISHIPHQFPVLIVEYNDGDIWKYNIRKLIKKTGPYANNTNHKNYSEYWHYGYHLGSSIINKSLGEEKSEDGGNR